MQILNGCPRLWSRTELGLLCVPNLRERVVRRVSHHWGGEVKLTMLVSLVAMGMIQNKSCPRVDRLQSSAELSPVHVLGLVHMALPEA